MKKSKKALHWITKEIFDEVTRRGLSLEGFERLVLAKTKEKISFQSMKYWRSGYSTPRVDQADTMAKALDLELDLFPTKRYAYDESE